MTALPILSRVLTEEVFMRRLKLSEDSALRGWPSVAQAGAGRASAESIWARRNQGRDKAPDFVAKDLAGKEYKLSSFAGKQVVLLNFWGLRCGACLEEMPYLEEIQKKLGPKGLVTLGVDTDGVDAKTIVGPSRRSR
jgi:thiol-disulfide isomerase/thioredoxin